MELIDDQICTVHIEMDWNSICSMNCYGLEPSVYWNSRDGGLILKYIYNVIQYIMALGSILVCIIENAIAINLCNNFITTFLLVSL